MRTFDKNTSYKTGDNPHNTPTRMPLITVDFMKDTGAKIRVGDEMKPLMKYWFTGEFHSQSEYENFLKTLVHSDFKASF